MPRTLLALSILALAIISPAQDQSQDQAAAARSQVAAAIAAAGCRPSELQFDVKGDNQRHPMPQAEPDKALLYVFETADAEGETSRIGLDSQRVGANQNGTYLFFAAAPGKHRLCVNVQSDKPAPPGTAGTMTVEAGRVYYFEVQVSVNRYGAVAGVQIQQLDDAQGQYMVATHSLSVTKKQTKASGNE